MVEGHLCELPKALLSWSELRRHYVSVFNVSIANRTDTPTEWA